MLVFCVADNDMNLDLQDHHRPVRLLRWKVQENMAYRILSLAAVCRSCCQWDSVTCKQSRPTAYLVMMWIPWFVTSWKPAAADAKARQLNEPRQRFRIFPSDQIDSQCWRCT